MENLVARAKAMLLTPQTEWKVIVGEAGGLSVLFPRYVAVLALIPALAHFIGSSLIGGYTPIIAGLVGALVGYVLTFLVVYVVALLIDMLAPTFNGQKNFSNALKLAVYSYTPVWIAGIFLLIPGLSFLAVLGLYGLYVLWSGLPMLMRAPPNRALPYAAAVVACALVLATVIVAIQAFLFGAR